MDRASLEAVCGTHELVAVVDDRPPTEQESKVNQALEKFIEERGDYTFPHARKTVDELFRLSGMEEKQRGEVITGIQELILSDPGFALNFSRFAKEEGAPLDTGKATSLREIIKSLGPHHTVAMLAPNEDIDAVFGEHDKSLDKYQKLSKEVSHHAKRISGEVGEAEQVAAVFMVIGAALPALAVISLAPEKATAAFARGRDHIQDVLGFALPDLAPVLDLKYGIPRNNDPAIPAALRAKVRDVAHSLREHFKPPKLSVARAA